MKMWLLCEDFDVCETDISTDVSEAVRRNLINSVWLDTYVRNAIIMLARPDFACWVR